MYINQGPEGFEKNMISYGLDQCPQFESQEEKFVPSYSYEEPPTGIFYNAENQVNVSSVMKENELLKKRLEMSEKLLFKLMNHQTLGSDGFFPMIPNFQDFSLYQPKQEHQYPTLE